LNINIKEKNKSYVRFGGKSEINQSSCNTWKLSFIL